MTKFLLLVEIDNENELITKICDDIDAIGDHVVPERAVNLDYVERKEGIGVRELTWGPGDTYPQVSVQPFKFKSGQYVEVILLPGEHPFKGR